MPLSSRLSVVLALGSAQTLAWASSYYLPAVLAAPMARDVGVATATVFGAFSAALVVSALVGPWSGRAIDRWGGRPVLMATNVAFAIGLAALGFAHGPISLFAAWLVLGVAMGSGLYEGGFAALVRLYGTDSRRPITGITLIAGFASTIGWPLSTLLEAHVGWRGACFAWAALHLVVGLPLNALLPRAPRLAPSTPAPAAGTARGTPVLGSASGQRRATWILAFVFATTWFVSTAMAAHLPRLLQLGGASFTAAIAIGALVGPAQVAGRLLEFGVLHRIHPLLSARIAALLHPAGAAVLAIFGGPAAAVFAILHGAGNGILTIAKGTLPLAFFGPSGYGARQGALVVPARIAQAFSPWLFGLGLERWGVGALWISGGLGIATFGALMLLPKVPEAPEAQAAEATGLLHPSS